MLSYLLVDRELLPQGQVFENKGLSFLEERHEQGGREGNGAVISLAPVPPSSPDSGCLPEGPTRGPYSSQSQAYL